ncbi:MAG TPA: hypothetical protein VLG16_02345 [Candidatus Saccharimonadales bacterium]|nr:hypothetical protein [Candidatus Saccharimonadales bacterium]
MSTPNTSNQSFDILSYPRAARTETIVVDTNGLTNDASDYPQHPNVLYGNLNGVVPDQTMLLTSQEGSVQSALALGAGVSVVNDNKGVNKVLDLLLEPASQTDQPLYDRPLYSDFSYAEVAEALFKPGEINIVGFVGRTGAGKSTTITRLIDTLHENGGYGGLFQVDAFFIRSRKDRKAWLTDPGISETERTERKRVITWWDLGRAAATLDEIRKGEHVHMEGLYDMQQGGEMVGTLDIDPGAKGYTVFVEGTALLVPELSRSIGSFVYLNTHDHVRAQLLMQRNLRDGYTPDDSHQRKVLTDAAETNEHIAYNLREQRFKSGALTVLDNTHRGRTLRLMPPYIPQK